MNDHYSRVPTEMPSIGDFLSAARRRVWSFIIPVVLVMSTAICIALLLPPVYRSTATILIEDQEIPTDFVTATVTSFAEQRLQQINQRVMSTSRLLEIINQFDLYKKMRAKRTTEEVVDQMRKDVILREISTEIMDRRTGRPTVATIAFSLTYQGKDNPATIQKVANVLMSLFLEENLEVRERQTSETSKFLEDEMNRVEEELADVETALADFKERHINELPELLELNIQQVGNAERSIERVEEQLRSVKEREGYLETQLANINPFLENVDRQQLEMLEVELATLRSRFSENHPDVKKAAGNVNALKEKIVQNGIDIEKKSGMPDNPAYVTLASQLASTRSEIESLGLQIKELNGAKAKYEGRIESTPTVEREYHTLTTKQMNLRAKYGDLMLKHMEAQVAHGLEKGQKGERFTPIDPPRLPEKPYKPNRLAIVLVGLFLGTGAGVGIAALREYSDHGIRKVDQLTQRTGIPVLGDVPVIITNRDRHRIRLKYAAVAVSIGLVIVVGILVFDLFIMDVNVFWAKISRRLIL